MGFTKGFSEIVLVVGDVPARKSRAIVEPVTVDPVAGEKLALMTLWLTREVRPPPWSAITVA